MITRQNCKTLKLAFFDKVAIFDWWNADNPAESTNQNSVPLSVTDFSSKKITKIENEACVERLYGHHSRLGTSGFVPFPCNICPGMHYGLPEVFTVFLRDNQLLQRVSYLGFRG